MNVVVPPGVTWLPGEPVARHTAVRVGGPCLGLMIVHQPDDLILALEALRSADLKVEWLGAGTRTWVRDGGWDRALVRLGVGGSRAVVEGDTVEVGGGCPCAAAAWVAGGAGLSGLEDLAARPGSVGAAVSLDDGRFRDSLAEVAIVARGGIRWRSPDEARGKPVVAARFRLVPADAARIVASTRAALADRRTIRSWYERPKRGTAEVELRRVQIVGVRLRGVLIPESAPETIVNPGRGPAADLQLLHSSALERIKVLRGIELNSTVTWVGRTA